MESEGTNFHSTTLQWHSTQASVLLTGSFDRNASVCDVRATAADWKAAAKWTLSSGPWPRHTHARARRRSFGARSCLVESQHARCVSSTLPCDHTMLCSALSFDCNCCSCLSFCLLSVCLSICAALYLFPFPPSLLYPPPPPSQPFPLYPPLPLLSLARDAGRRRVRGVGSAKRAPVPGQHG